MKVKKNQFLDPELFALKFGDEIFQEFKAASFNEKKKKVSENNCFKK